MKRPKLSSGEEVVKAFRPHWKQLIWPGFASVVAIAAIVVLFVFAEGTWMWVGIAATIAIWLFLAIPPLIDWLYTHYVITNERVIVRRGMIARHGLEIPLEVINDVTFHQSIIERVVGSGDLIIESAGERGQSHFSDIPDPDEIQADIYRLRETRTVALQGAPGQSAAEQIETLARLHDQGVLSDEEFAEKKTKLLGQI
jgi:uncharacterized membrane protein YdbT with pleckstrin-like domain